MSSLTRTLERGAEPGARIDHAIGNTPLIGLRRIIDVAGPRVLVKVEGLQPGGSVKARAARAIVAAAMHSGRLRPGMTLLDASSGNTGIAYAMLCAAGGFACTICMPANASAERRQLLRAYGATIVSTPPEDGSDGAIREARRIAAASPDGVFYADQYGNPANVRAHEDGTGVEIWQQTEGAVTHFVAGLGTSGTFMGVGRRLRRCNPRVSLIAVQPDSPFHGIEGLKHMATAIVPRIYDAALADRTIEVRTEAAQAMALRLAREEGLLAGVSGGANVVAALEVARSAPDDAVIVTVLPDGGERYLSEPWLRGRP